jgi:hypothetical protein
VGVQRDRALGSLRGRKRLDVELGAVLARRPVLVALVLLALGDLGLIAVAHSLVGSGVDAARRGVGVVLIVGGLGRDRLLVDVVRVIADEVRGRVVGLVGLDVLAHRDAPIGLRRGVELLGRVFGHRDDRDLLLGLGRLLHLGLGLGRLRLGHLGFLDRGRGRDRSRLGRGYRRLCHFLAGSVDRGDLEGLRLVADPLAHLLAHGGDGQPVVVELGDRVPALAQHEVRAYGGADPEHERCVCVSRHRIGSLPLC